MLSDDKTGLLKALLGSLPGTMAARLARAVEVDKLMDGGVLPHGEILSSLRPALRSDQPDRTASPLRLFCEPFEDLLTNEPRLRKQKAVIARASVMAVWRWLSQVLMPADCATYLIETRALILSKDDAELAVRAEYFRTRAAAAMTAALSDEHGAKAARALLGGELVVADAKEMAVLLPAGKAAQRIQALMPKPVASLDEKLLWDLRAVYDKLVLTQPDAAPYVAAIIMNRLLRPWEALKLPMNISRQHHDTLISKTDMGLVGEILISQMDGLQARIQATRHPAFDVEKLLEEVHSFAELSSAVVKEIEIRRDGEWGQRLLKDRQIIGGVMEELMERAVKELAAALPMQKGGGRTADFGRPVDPQKHELARRYVRLVTGCRPFAAAACFAAKQNEIFEDLCAYLKRYNEDVLKGLRSADPAGTRDCPDAVCALRRSHRSIIQRPGSRTAAAARKSSLRRRRLASRGLKRAAHRNCAIIKIIQAFGGAAMERRSPREIKKFLFDIERKPALPTFTGGAYPVENSMIRTPLFAVLAVALLGGTAMAAPAGAPAASGAPDNAQYGGAQSSRDYDDGDNPNTPPPANAGTKASAEQARAERDMFCRRDAAAHTGYTTPGEAARDEQARGSIGGALGGAALGAIIGGSGRHGNAGSGAAIGAGAGLLAGTAVGAANAHQAAADVQRAYSDAYYACMDEADADGPPPPRYARGGYAYGYDSPYGPPPPYYGYGLYPYPYPYYYPPYYGPSIYFGFGGRGWGGYHGGHGWHR